MINFNERRKKMIDDFRKYCESKVPEDPRLNESYKKSINLYIESLHLSDKSKSILRDIAKEVIAPHETTNEFLFENTIHLRPEEMSYDNVLENVDIMLDNLEQHLAIESVRKSDLKEVIELALASVSGYITATTLKEYEIEKLYNHVENYIIKLKENLDIDDVDYLRTSNGVGDVKKIEKHDKKEDFDNIDFGGKE